MCSTKSVLFRRAMVAIGLASIFLTGVAHASFSAEPSTISVPEGPGSIQGMGESFDVSAHTGLASYGFEFPVPAGPGGFAPALSFSYSSGSPNGLLGVGWSINEARICRATDTGFPEYRGFDENDSFVIQGSGGQGQLVPIPEWANTGGAGTWVGLRDVEAWIRVRPASELGDGHGWLVERPDGVIAHYGISEAGREGRQNQSFTDTYCWSLEQEINPWGRRINYDYTRDGERLYLSEIRYGEDTSRPKSLVFEYEARGDILGDWRAGFLREYAQRLKGVAAYAGASSQRKLTQMNFSYEENWNTSRLVRAQLIGEHGEALPPHTFTYGEFSLSAMPRIVAGPSILPSGGGYHLVDIDGDSFPDLVRANATGWAYYKNLQGNGFERSVRQIQGPPSFVGTSSDWTFLDLDGDGLRDVVVREGSSGALRGYRNVSSGDGESAAFEYLGELGVRTPVPLNDPRMRLMDLNLDRRIDILLAQANGQLSSSLSHVERDEDGLVRSSSLVSWDGLVDVANRPSSAAPAGKLSSMELNAPGLQLADMNGDGLDDIVRFFGGAQQITSAQVYPSRGNGQFDTGYAITALPADLRGVAPERVRLLDMNRDGLGDAVVIDNNGIRIWLNRGGNRFSEVQTVQLPARSSSAEVYLEDMDGDGAVDIVIIDPQKSVWTIIDVWDESKAGGLLVRAANGMGGRYELEYQSFAQASQVAADYGTPWRRWIPQAMRVAANSTTSDSREWSATTRRIYRDPVWDHAEGAFRGFRSATVVQDGNENESGRVTDFVFYTGIGREVRDLGVFFGRPQGNFAVPDLAGLNGRPRSIVRRTEDGLLLSQELYRYELKQLSAYRDYILPAETLAFQPEGARLAPKPGEVDGEWSGWTASRRQEEPGEQQRWLRRVLQEHDDFGNVLRSSELGFVDMSGNDIPGDERTTETDYILSIVPWRVGVPSEQRVTDGRGKILTRTRTYYDGEDYKGLPLGEIRQGAVTRTTLWHQGLQRWIDVARMAIDDVGNVSGVLDALGHFASLEYDADTRSLPVRETMHLAKGTYGHRKNPAAPEVLSVTASYDLDRGLVTAVSDFNGSETRIAYDGLGREVQRVQPGDSEDFPTLTYRYVFGDNISYLQASARERTGQSDTLDQWIYVDGLGRSLVSVEGAEGRGYAATGFQSYNTMGEVALTGHDFEVSGPSLPTQLPSDVPFLQMFYDAAGRQVETILEDGSVVRQRYLPGEQWAYDPNDTDPSSPHFDTPTILGVDGLGREIYTRLLLDRQGTTRDYRSQWDARDLLVSRELPDGSLRTWNYDSLGRRTSVTDPNAGTSWREYDDVGNVIAQINATGEYIHTAYDAVGRIASIAHAADAGGERDTIASYVYDVAASSQFPANHSLGRLTARRESTFATYLDYDARGQASRIFRELDGKVYTQGSAFDAMGRLERMVYAGGSESTFRYDHRSRILSISEMVDAVEYHPNGTVESVRYANGVVREHEHDVRRMLRHYSLRSGSGDSLLDLRMDYDRAGVPVRLEDTLDPESSLSQSKDWDYDALYRPTEMHTPSLGTVEYRFNEANNLASRRIVPGAAALDQGLNVKPLDVGIYQFGGNALEGLSAGPHQVSSVADRRLGYDPNGQLVQDRRVDEQGRSTGERHFFWDPSGRLTRVELQDGRSIEYGYDGGFVRTERRHQGADSSTLDRTVYLSPLEELVWAGQKFDYKKFVYLESERVAEVRQQLDPGVLLSDFSAPIQASWNDSAQGLLFGVRSVGASEFWAEIPAWATQFNYLLSPVVLLILSLFTAVLAALILARLSRGRRWNLSRRAVALTAALSLALAGLPGCGEDEVEPPPPPMIDAKGVVIFFHAPLLGTPVVQTDRHGELYNRQVSTPFGVRITHEGEDENAFLFTDKPWDSDLDLIYFGARYYDAELGTWLSVDPLALWGDDGEMGVFDLNGMVYVGGRVTIAVDLFGFEGKVDGSNDVAMEHFREGILAGSRAARAEAKSEVYFWHDDKAMLEVAYQTYRDDGWEDNQIKSSRSGLITEASQRLNMSAVLDGAGGLRQEAIMTSTRWSGVSRAARGLVIGGGLLVASIASGGTATIPSLVLLGSSVGGGVMQAATGDANHGSSLLSNVAGDFARNNEALAPHALGISMVVEGGEFFLGSSLLSIDLLRSPNTTNRVVVGTDFVFNRMVLPIVDYTK